MVRFIRYLLYPFSVIYGLIITIRNYFYDSGILHSVGFDLPVICVGNLSVGGSGKTPMVEYLVELLKDDYKLAILSRGYKRKSEGIFIAGDDASAEQIGDEPMQFYSKYYPSVIVTVSKYRVPAVPAILNRHPDIQSIILDDALQHRAIRAGLNILLTTRHNPYYDDVMLPTGNLRDERKSSRRADIIVVTKCEPNLSEEDGKNIVSKINPQENRSVFFATLTYGEPYHLFDQAKKIAAECSKALLVTGIAHPGYLHGYLKNQYALVERAEYSDHYFFEEKDIQKILQQYNSSVGEGGIIITTEKDAVKLVRFSNLLNSVPVFVLPVKHTFLFDQAPEFERLVTNFVADFGK